MQLILNKNYRLYRKSLTILIIFTLIFSSLPASHFSTVQEATAAAVSFTGGTKFEKTRHELVEKRTEKSKTFANPDGTFTTEISQSPIHYKNSLAEWVSIDNTLVSQSSSNEVVNKANSFQVKFKKQNLLGSLVNLDINGMSISMDPISSIDSLPADFMTKQVSVVSTYNQNKVTYKGLYKGVNLRYTVGNQKVKEDIILQQKPDLSTPTNFSFKFNLKGLNVTQDKSGQVSFTNSKTGETVFYLEQPFMYDSNVPAGYQKKPQVDDFPEGSRSNDVQMKVVKRGSNFYVDVIPDRTWLDDPSRVYPVYIDPTIVRYQPDASVGIDTNIRSYFPTQTGGTDTTLGVGLYKDPNQTNVIRSLLNFNVSSIPQGSTILSAKLNLWMASVYNNTPIGIEVHEGTRTWTESGASWNSSNGTTSWTNKGGDFVSTATDTVAGIGSLTDLSVNYKWDITSLVRKWFGPTPSNNGIILKSNAETTNTYKKFISSDDTNNAAYRPMLAVTYYPASRLGLEDFWTYDSHALVGGQSSTNMTTGNNVVQFTDVALEGRGGMGVTFNRTYNSKAVDDSPVGFGWSFTGGESVVERLDQSKAIYTDRDGTAHEFTYNSTTGIYNPPAGTYLKLTRTTDTGGSLNGYDITYKHGLKLHFNAKSDSNQDIINGKIQYVEDRHGNRITYGYNTSDQVITITDPSGRQTALSYYTTGRISMIIDFASHKTAYGYDASGNLTTVDRYVDAANYRRTQYSYDSNHHLLTIIDPKGRKTDFTYTAELLQKVQEPFGDGVNADLSTRPGTTYWYDLPNYVAKATDRNGNTTTYNSNANYVVTKITDPLGRITSSTLDPNYNATQVTDPKSNQTTYSYDGNGNVTSTTDPEQHSVTSVYDAYSNITSSTDALGKQTSYDYNSAGDLVTVTNPLLQQTTYTYDSYGNRMSTTDGNHNQTTYGYDANGINQISMTDSAGKITTMEYDTADNLIKITEPNGHVTTQQFNWLNELEQMDEKVSDSSVPEFSLDPTYDLNGNTQSVTDTVNGTSATTNYDHTATNDVQTQTVQATQQIGYQYDNNQNLIGWNPQAGWGRGLQFSYDASNQLTQVKDSTSLTIVEDYGYDLNGNATAIQRTGTDGVLQSMTYNKVNQLTDIQNKKGTTTLSGFSYSLDANGRILSVIDNQGATKSFSYDELGRMKNYTDSSGTTSYTFDAVGNRLTKTAPNGTANYTYNNLNQLTSRNGTEGNASYLYNTKGELVDNAGTQFDWNTDGKIVKVTKSDGSTVEFLYNAKGQRTEKITKNATGTILSDFQYQYEDNSDNLVVETNTTTSSTTTYSYDSLGRRISQMQGGNTFYYNYDGHGNVVGLSDSSGNVVSTYSYDPWGNIISKTGTIFNPFTYSGYYFDEETGLYYLINRYYDPVDGRFLSQDSVEPMSANLYIYGDNDPVNRVDPDGNFALAVGGIYLIPGVGEIALGVTLAVGAGLAVGYGINKGYQYFANREKMAKENKMRGGDAKKREAKQIKDKFGKRSQREKNTNELHKDKVDQRNDHNRSWKDLNNYR